MNMSYTHQFDQAHVDRYREAATVRSVLHRMGGLDEKSSGDKPPHKTITEYRIAEMDHCCDWGESYTDAPWLILHHARNASDELGRTINNWMSPVCTSGLKGLGKEATNSVKNIRGRIDPTLYGIEKELDPHKAARAAYDALEEKALQAINDLFNPANTTHIPKSKLRAYHISDVCQILSEYQQDLQAWSDELRACINTHPS